MHDIEPFYNWRHIYTAETDERSPFFGRQYSEFTFTNTVYNYFIHPQWDDFGSRTLYVKILFVEYESAVAILELMGEWNDAIENDIMTLKRDLIDEMQLQGIAKFILVGEHVMNFHSGDRDYYEEWFEEVTENEGWIVLLNLPEHSQHDFKKMRLHRYIELKELPNWRTYKPHHLFRLIAQEQENRLH